MLDTPEFAVEFAKIALLTNVGRINTTMACAYAVLSKAGCNGRLEYAQFFRR